MIDISEWIFLFLSVFVLHFVFDFLFVGLHCSSLGIGPTVDEIIFMQIAH